jgi:hypothetical protein
VIFRNSLPILILLAGASSVANGSAPTSQTAPSAVPGDGRAHDSPRLRWKPRNGDPVFAAVEVAGADPASLKALTNHNVNVDGWTSFLAVRVVPAPISPKAELPPLWGSYRIDADIIRFEPRFPLQPGMTYRAEFDPARLRALTEALTPNDGGATGKRRSTTRLSADYSPPLRVARSTTRVVSVWPSRELLPENLLRLYVSFSAPMSRGEAYRRIKLVDASAGKPVDAPFLELEEELWSPDGTRFTLLFDPGRIKRGLRPREELGPVLEDGKSYSLLIETAWPDAMGNPLMSPFRKNFRVGQPDETSPDPKNWTLTAPRASSREPLEVRFPESLDRALLDRLITVQDARALTVPGRVSVGESETKWWFTPLDAWKVGDYSLKIGTELEDLAGNSVARPFEVDVAGPISRRITPETVELPFRIGPAHR